MTTRPPQRVIKIVIETYATDEDMDYLIENLVFDEIYDALGLGWDSNEEPLKEEIIAVDWEK